MITLLIIALFLVLSVYLFSGTSRRYEYRRPPYNEHEEFESPNYPDAPKHPYYNANFPDYRYEIDYSQNKRFYDSGIPLLILLIILFAALYSGFLLKEDDVNLIHHKNDIPTKLKD